MFATITLAAASRRAICPAASVWSKVLRFGAGQRNVKAHTLRQIARFLKGAAGGSSDV